MKPLARRNILVPKRRVRVAAITVLRLDVLIRCFMLYLHIKGASALRVLRPILAMLIALSLALAPVASATADTHGHDTAALSGGDDAGALTDDCARMGMGGAKSDCPCSDTKSKCADAAACLAKSGRQVMGFLTPVLKVPAPATQVNWPRDVQEPPDWSLRPPAPPPRA